MTLIVKYFNSNRGRRVRWWVVSSHPAVLGASTGLVFHPPLCTPALGFLLPPVRKWMGGQIYK